jgi:hypothetical protein
MAEATTLTHTAPKSGVLWLMRAFGWRQGRTVAAAYRTRLDPRDESARLILDDLARYCRAGATSFVAGDPHQTAFNEGARDAFLHVVEMVGLKPSDFPLDLPDGSASIADR